MGTILPTIGDLPKQVFVTTPAPFTPQIYSAQTLVINDPTATPNYPSFVPFSLSVPCDPLAPLWVALHINLLTQSGSGTEVDFPVYPLTLSFWGNSKPVLTLPIVVQTNTWQYGNGFTAIQPGLFNAMPGGYITQVAWEFQSVPIGFNSGSCPAFQLPTPSPIISFGYRDPATEGVYASSDAPNFRVPAQRFNVGANQITFQGMTQNFENASVATFAAGLAVLQI